MVQYYLAAHHQQDSHSCFINFLGYLVEFRLLCPFFRKFRRFQRNSVSIKAGTFRKIMKKKITQIT